MRARIGAVVVLALVVTTAACGDDPASTNQPGVTTASVPSTTATTTQPIVDTTASEIETVPPGAEAETTSPPTSAVAPALPSSAAATSAFEAWMTGDSSRVALVADPAVAEFMSRRALEPGSWEGPTCEGAAGSTYCSWVSADATVVLWLANQLGGAKVMGVRLEPPPGGVAVWPLTTSEEAANTQQSVDEGHSPWQLDPDAVVISYAENVLGFADPEVEHTPLNVRVVDPSGIAVSMHLVQPARQGSGGIWAIKDVYANGVPN